MTCAFSFFGPSLGKRGAGLLCCLIVIAVADAGAVELSDLVSPETPVRKLVGDCKFTEGPAWSPQGFLLFSDIPNNRVVKLLTGGATSDFLNPSGEANGMMFDVAGRLYICQGGERRIVRIDNPETRELTILADSYDGKRLNSPNDVALDRHGGVYFSDPRYRGTEPLEQPVMGVYYIDASGKVTRVIEDLERPNGVAVSPDGAFLYVAEPNHRQLYRYPILEGGELAAGSLIFTGDANLDGGGPDGMALDAHGNVYTAFNGIVALTPDGHLIGRIPVPEHVSNCAFGDQDNKTLFITARTSVYALAMQVPGIGLQPASKPVVRSQAVANETRAVASGFTDGRQSEQKNAGAAPDKPDAKEAGEKETGAKKVKAGNITLLVPETWKQNEATRQFRVAEFEIPPAKGDASSGELVVYDFGNGGGTVQENIDRWTNQFEFEGRTSKILEFKSDKLEYTLVDLTGTYKKPIGPPNQGKSKPMPGWRMLAVIHSSESGRYFLKLDGPLKTIKAAEEEFRVSFGGNAKEEKERKAK